MQMKNLESGCEQVGLACFKDNSFAALNEVRISSCDRESLSADPAFQSWLSFVLGYVSSRLGNTRPRLKVYAYEHGIQTIIALDIFTNQHCSDMAITILISPDCATLALPVDDQLDIALPSLASVLDFAAKIANCHKKVLPRDFCLEILSWEGRHEEQHEIAA